MSSLQLNVLGSVGALLDSQPLQNPGIKSLALLIYLAVERDRPHRRESLFTLLWPGMPEKSARHNLNQTVYALRQVIPDHEDNNGETTPLLSGNRHTIQLNPNADTIVDIHQMDDLLESTRTHVHPDLAKCPKCIESLEVANAIYKGDFLSDFYLEDSNKFEEWAQSIRESYRRKLIDVLETLSEIACQKKDFEQALIYIDRQLALDEFLEHAHCQKIQILSLTGRRVEAMRQYRVFAHHLEEQLGTTPSQETAALYKRIRTEDLAVRHPFTVQQTSKPAMPRHNLPPQPTPFIGRQQELAQLDEMLIDPDIRLITIVGPGGMGKTRLAIACAERNLAHEGDSENHPFSDGIFFVPFVQVEEPDQMVFKIAQVINLQLEDSRTISQSPKEQLLNFLQEQKMLLLADNFEHLLDKTELLTDILRFAPNVQILVTSRERLYLQVEHIFPLGGLGIIDSKSLKITQEHPAIKLFSQSARQINSSFTLKDREDIENITHICQLVDGTPLALELAAKWINVLTLPEIVTEIENNLDFLETDLLDVPARQRSMRAVFNATWHKLTKNEQDVFIRFSVFQGGCTRAAAQKVAGASIKILARLSDKSLIQYQNNMGRYQIHELMRQFAADILSQDAETEALTHKTHCEYYCSGLVVWENKMKSPSHAAVLKEISADYQNIHQAWDWALAKDDIPSLLKAVDGLGEYFDSARIVNESTSIFKTAIGILEDRHGIYPKISDAALLLALLYARHTFLIPTGLGWITDEDIDELAGRSLALLSSPVLAKTDTRRETALIYYKLGTLNYYKLGTFILSEESLSQLELCLHIYREMEDHTGIGDALYRLAYMARIQGDVGKCEQYITECLAIRRKTGDPSRLGATLHLVAGNYRLNQFDYDKALSYYEEAYAVYEQGGILLGMAEIQKNVAFLKWFLGEFDIALEYLAAARDITLQSGNQYLATTYLTIIGLCQSWNGQFDQAIGSVQDALESKIRIKKETPTLLLAEIYLHIGQYEVVRRLNSEYDSESLFVTNNFWFHRNCTWLALIEGDYDKALAEGKLCLNEAVKLNSVKQEWGAWARSLLGQVYLDLGRVGDAKSVHFKALQSCVEIRAFIPLMHLMPILSVVLAANEDEVLQERAVELYALAKTQPFVANSRLFEDIAEKPLQVATANLQEDIILAAQTRGQKLEWWQTADNLLKELQELGWPSPSENDESVW